MIVHAATLLTANCYLKILNTGADMVAAVHRFTYIDIYLYRIIIVYRTECLNLIYHIYQYSTAQHGGGSFKKRVIIVTIGEIGCCESRMSEQKH